MNSPCLKLLAIDLLEPGPYQPRQFFDETSLKELAQSIRTQGIIEPLLVQPTQTNRYEIIAGERRWRAAMLAGLAEVPCLIHHYNQHEAAAIALIENIQRDDLTIWEEANAYQRLLDEFEYHQEDIAQIVGKSRSHIANILRLLQLSPSIQKLVQSKQLSFGHARALVGLSQSLQMSLAQKVLKFEWSVRKLEQEVKRCKSNIESKKLPELSQDTANLQNHLSEQLGAPVQLELNPQQQGGWLKIKFYNNDTLQGLLERFGLSYD